MAATVTKTKKSVIPIYLVGVAWLVYGATQPLRTPFQFLLCGILSAVAYLVGRMIFPDQTYTMPVEEKAQEEPKSTGSTGDPETDKLMEERERAVREMERLNDSIRDPEISAKISHLEEMTGKIIGVVVANPKKLPQIRKFMNYYLPTTLKILNAYDRMAATGIEGENITATKNRVAGMLDTICLAFDKQLDSLYGEEALDISTDITVMEQMLQREGIGGMTMNASL